MNIKAKPIRSSLYVPGNNEEWIRKAPKYGSDALILDLEDSVPEPEKSQARTIVRKMLEELGGVNQALFVRVNRLETGMTGDDLEAIVCENLYGIILPKVETARDIIEIDVLLKLFERRAGIPEGSVLVDPGLETAQAIREAYSIATSSNRITHMGGSGGKGGDTARSIGFQWTPEGMETLFLKSKVLIDARAAQIPYPMSGGWFDIHDLNGLEKLAIQLKQLGYTGMNLIHPYHVPVVNKVFTPSKEEIEHYKGLIEAMNKMRQEGGAAVTYNGDMVDVAHEETAKSMIKMVEQWGITY
ncbi:MAG TPA: CoA ester lyase [Dehalococcoidia bacterium]|jgi:citrate lyase subunit beta / citryl-CoA lyase|nr:CoA ester lyase [Dehalococcoidia bacterium]|tara:strand:+ start:768 stop:1667 length:900 start_codon:yes stop_codon:yes gene_type:complete